MAARALGALLALLAALLFAAALAGGVLPNAVPTWWDGHPRVAEKTLDRKAIHIGLIGAHGCNLGDTIECESIETGVVPKLLGFAELGALGLVTLTTIALLISIWTFGDRRRGLGRVAIIEALIAGAIGAVWLALGPGIKAGASVSVPIGLGFYAFGSGVACAVIAGVLAPRGRREPLRLKTSRRLPAPAMPIAPTPDPLAAFDISELAPPRPSQNAIPPTPAFQSQYMASPLPVPAGTGPQQPIARPSPLPPQMMPVAPVAKPQAIIASEAGRGAIIASEAGGAIIEPPSVTGPPAPTHTPLFENAPQLRPLYDMANVGVVPSPVPPRLPERPPTPIPRASLVDTAEVPKPAPAPTPRPAPAAITPTPRTKAASLPPMPPRRTPPSTSNAVPERISKQPTISVAVPPMPAATPGPPTRASTEAEPQTTVEIDAEAKAKWQAQQARGKPAPAPETPRDTDEQPVAPTPDATDQVELRDPPPVLEGPTALDPNADRALADTMLPANASPAVTVDNALERSAPPMPHRPSSSTLKPPTIAVPKTIAPKPMPSAHAPVPQIAPKPEVKPEPKPEVKVPLSTAPASLPPPKHAQPATSGPTPACPQCEAPMAWVEEHLRFYCKQCRMYF